jgi:hypothetical protein
MIYFFKKLFINIFFLIFFTSCSTSQDISNVPIKVDRNKTLVSIRIGNVEIPDIILDSEMPFDGVLIYNTEYKDSLDLSNAIRVKIGGAGDDSSSNALMIDSAKFKLANLEMKNQKIILLTSDTYKGFPSNGIIGYSIFGHYTTEIDYDKNIMTLYDTGNKKIDNEWTEIPMYFKNNNIPWVDASVVIEDEEPIQLSVYIDYASGDAIDLLVKPGMKFYQ